MTDSPFRTPGDYFRLNDLQDTHTKDFQLMDTIYRDILRRRGDRAFYIRVEHYNIDLWMGESRTKVLDHAFDILVWNPNLDEDNVTPAFAKSGFSFINEGELTYYVPMSYFVDAITEERTFTNESELSFIENNVLYFYGADLTDESLYSFLAGNDEIVLDSTLNSGEFQIEAIEYVDASEIENSYTAISLISLDSSEDMIDEDFPIGGTIFVDKVVNVRPKIDDLIWIPKLEQLYQVTYVNDTPPHLMFNRNLSFVFRVSLYDYNTNIKVDSQVISKAPELADLENLNDLILNISNDVIDTAIEDGNVLDETEEQERETAVKPTSKFDR
jgi:hypothetical protein